MTRVKTFDNTGIATSGRLYAGDLNLIQDQFADLINLLQTHAVGTLQVGESGLQLLRYGAGEARISGALRIDGIFRGLGGLYAGAFTTAQRDAITAGSRPYGLIILNTTTNRPEWNSGTDAVPAWIAFSDANAGVPVGTTIDWSWTHTQLPSNYLLCYGQAVSRATYPVLAAIAAASSYPHGNGDGSTTFNLPDFRGRVAVGRDDMGTVAAGRVTAGGSGINGATLGAVGGVQSISLATGELPVHNHGLVAATITGTPALTGVPNISGTVGNGTLAAVNNTLAVGNGTLNVNAGNLTLPNHVHSITDQSHAHVYHDRSDNSVYNGGMNGGYGADAVTDYRYTGITGTNNPTSLPGISGAPALTGAVSLSGSVALSGAISNNTLSIVIGSLSVNANTLDVGGTTDNAGSGTAHSNMQPSLVVNVAMRAA